MAGDEHYYMICLICLFVSDFILKEKKQMTTFIAIAMLYLIKVLFSWNDGAPYRNLQTSEVVVKSLKHFQAGWFDLNVTDLTKHSMSPVHQMRYG